MSTKRTPPHHWFSNPTESAAIRNFERRERQAAEKPEYGKVYICSPYRGNIETNTANAIRYCKFAAERGFIPICPHIYLTQFLNDDVPEERKLGLSLGIKLLRECKELWIFSNTISEGMKQEIKVAEKLCITIKHFNENMEELRHEYK